MHFEKKRDLYLNQFSNKKGAIDKPESPKKHPIWAAHPRTHLSTKYPPGGFTIGRYWNVAVLPDIDTSRMKWIQTPG